MNSSTLHIMKSYKKSGYTLAFLIIAFLSACSKPAEVEETPVVMKPLVTGDEITIIGDDRSKYDITAFSVLPNQEITLTLVYEGKMAMKHNVAIVDKDTDAQAFAQDSAAAIKNDYISTKPEFTVIAHTKMIGPGEKDSITFTTPSEPGVYPYVCTFPGHYFIGMKGIMTVVAE